jgi:tetratricopeptide (TPR) repeat protein
VPRIDYEAKATALFNAGDLDGARENFELATRFAPTARAWTNYGVTLQRLGDYPGASSAYRAAVGVDANYLEAWLYQARLASEMKDAAKAVPLLQRALAINPHSPDVNIELARLEADAKNWTETRKFAEEAIRSDPTNARGQWYFAVASDQLKDGDAAIRGYTAYLQYVGAAERDQAQFVGWARTRLAELRGKL